MFGEVFTKGNITFKMYLFHEIALITINNDFVYLLVNQILIIESTIRVGLFQGML